MPAKEELRQALADGNRDRSFAVLHDEIERHLASSHQTVRDIEETLRESRAVREWADIAVRESDARARALRESLLAL